MVRPVAGDLPEQVKNNQSVNMAAGNGGQKMSQYPWFTVYVYSGGRFRETPNIHCKHTALFVSLECRCRQHSRRKGV